MTRRINVKKNWKRCFPAFLFLLILVIVGMGGCATSECYDNKNSLPLAGFYSAGERPQPIALDSISILGLDAPGNSVLQDSVRGLSQVYLPFRIDENSTAYEIRYLSGLPGELRMYDLITFNYEIVPMFVSSACGVVYYYKIESIDYTKNFIDSVACPSGVITNISEENLKIYFRVAEEEEE